ncbi:LysM-repeat protein [Prochlorococcus sp. SS52]|nr:LysM-repeat protein [Prochlorococcus marinus str. LG]KGG18892.1 LysM-repeat protein [Prochlorococcus marinus str. SS2]KGG23570.1 LysM-repeat protein [Prochlorococcus marinus str. SS35]KGG32194.1 LysM-repeat protein [Prochlorococcus marinus str. SS51]KGG35114.1 LysM-repeat protein [Prochlorococcus sp. SS52]
MPASNKSNKKIYIAIDCSKSLLNVTDSNLNWREWSQAMVNFEKELIRDWCNR